MRRHDVLLDRLDKKLRHLRRAKLVPRKCCLASLDHKQPYSVSKVVDWNLIYKLSDKVSGTNKDWLGMMMDLTKERRGEDG